MSTLPRPAPDFELQDQDGQLRRRSEFLARGPLLIVFFPAAFTPVCTKQLCSYRDAGDEFRDLGIQILGISYGSPEKHRKFREQFQFDFPLLSDPEKKTAKAFGAVSRILLGAVTRANFVVDSRGTIIAEHIDGVPILHQHASTLSEMLARLKAEGQLS